MINIAIRRGSCMNYGNTVTITPCVRFQSNRKPGLPVQQGLSDGNRIHKAQTGGRGSPRAVPSLRHPFLPHARIRTRAPVGRHRCRCTGRTVCAFASGRVLYTVTFPESPSRPPIAPAAVTVWPRVWLDLPSVTSIVSQLSTPMQKLPPATPWTV